MKQVLLSKKHLKQIVMTWTDYFVENKRKLFHSNVNSHLKKIVNSKGFQITAFAGKAQNEYTHPHRLPDLGELNLLCKIKAIQILTKKPARIIYDGEYYAHEFKEDIIPIKRYEDRISYLSEFAGINSNFKKEKTTFTVEELITHLNISKRDLINQIIYFDKTPDKAIQSTEIYPKDLLPTINRILPADFKKSVNGNLTKDLKLKFAERFIVYKAALASVLKHSYKEARYQRITILKYTKANYPRVKLEMNIAPWNSTILFYRTFKNINTARNSSYKKLKQDERNYPIIGRNNYFWGFTRNPEIFSEL